MDPKQELIKRAKEVAARPGRTTLTRAEFSREASISQRQVYKYFDGWRDLCLQADLEPNLEKVRLVDDQIYSEMRDTFIRLGGIATRTRFDREFRYSVDVFKKRGMNWPAALAAFRRWCERNAPDFPYLQDRPRLPISPGSACRRASPDQGSDRCRRAGSAKPFSLNLELSRGEDLWRIPEFPRATACAS
jgi:hypothetical protein